MPQECADLFAKVKWGSLVHNVPEVRIQLIESDAEFIGNAP